jgi:muramoyltetrapeptide carboxypeptidase LdcA involved in peptidoglycan recycling
MPTRPAALRPGDTIGIVSPSWGGPAFFPHRLERGIAQIEAMGYRALVAPHARNQHGYVSDTPEARASDINALFADPEVRAIIASVGGDHSCQLLPLLDYELIRANPKIFMGYSDITVLNVALYVQSDLVTFNGPALLTDFAEFPQMYGYTEHYLRKTICETTPAGLIEPATEWTEEFLDWAQQEDLTRPRAMQPTPGWQWIKAGSGTGPLIGGCLESLQHLRGTPYWPNWRDAILFIETSEEAPSPATVDGILMDYENMGVFAQLQGLLVGRPMGYSEAQKAELREIIRQRTEKFSFPIVTDMDFGHTAPQFVLPIGCRAQIDSVQQRFALIEAAVKVR